MNKPLASVVIPTRNRRDLLRENLIAVSRQTVLVEIVVVDDGSTDGTPEMMNTEFPQARYIRFTGEPHGPTFTRNRGSEVAAAPILFPIDDDAVLTSSRTIEQTLADFDNPRIGAVGMPYINVQEKERHIRQQPPDNKELWVEHTFVGAAHAIRRDVFLAIGGYREHLFYMGEEGDLTLRMLAAGFVTRLGRADPVHHHESPNRVTARANFYGRRNDVFFALHNVPAADLPAHLTGTIINGLSAATRARHPQWMLGGLAAGFYEGARRWGVERRPVSREIYRLQRRLKKCGPLRLRDIEGELPSVNYGLPHVNA